MNHLTAASIMEEPDVRSFRGKSRAEGDRIFRRAARHGRFVRFLRIAIPVGIIAILGVIVAAAFFNPFQVFARLPIDPGKLLISGTKITMEQPRLAGFTRDARPYELTARAAAQDLARPEMLELKDIYARMQMQDKAIVEMRAANGFYDTKADVLRLGENILLSSSSGYEGRLSEAVVDIKKGIIVSESPVEVKLLNGTLNANRLEIAENGAVILFERGVQMVLILNSERRGQQKATSP